MPTGLDCGIAVPHGRTDAVSGIVGAVALVDNSASETGTIADYETIDHSAIQIIVLTVAPESAQSPYLQLMAFISRALRANNGYERLLGCKTEEEMRRIDRMLNDRPLKCLNWRTPREAFTELLRRHLLKAAS